MPHLRLRSFDKYDIIPMVEGITLYRIIFAFFKEKVFLDRQCQKTNQL